MEKLSVEKRTEVSKMSTERLRAELIKAGYDEDEVFEMDRGELLSTYAEYLLSPRIPESPEKAEGGAVGGISAEEWEFRKQELELKRQKEERIQREEERRKQELEFQKQKEEKEEERRKQEFEFQKETGEGRSAERRRSRSAETA